MLVKNKFDTKGVANSILRHYQWAGAKFIRIGKKIILADEMGTGKSIQTIQALLDLDVKHVLILCPATLKPNWQNEFRKHYSY